MNETKKSDRLSRIIRKFMKVTRYEKNEKIKFGKQKYENDFSELAAESSIA